MTGFCESCGTYQDPGFPNGGTLTQLADGRYLCARCFANDGRSDSAPKPIARISWRPARPAGASATGPRWLVVAGAIGIIAAVASWQLLAPPDVPVEGGVLGVIQSSTAPTTSGRRDAPSSGEAATPLASRAPSPPPASLSPSADAAPANTAFQLGEAAAVLWRGSLGETRLEVIVPVRNVSSGWIQLPRSTSTYRVVDTGGREIASGVFTASLPVTVGPRQVGYLVDTVSVAFIPPGGTPSVKAEVQVIAANPPTTKLSVADLAASMGDSGGLRVTGRVRNDGSRPTTWVIAGAVLLGENGRPLAAVYDPSDVGRLDPGAALPFDTEYPGAPPRPASAGTTLVGIAFETLDALSR